MNLLHAERSRGEPPPQSIDKESIVLTRWQHRVWRWDGWHVLAPVAIPQQLFKNINV